MRPGLTRLEHDPGGCLAERLAGGAGRRYDREAARLLGRARRAEDAPGGGAVFSFTLRV